jgi:hypothetical protein
MSYPYVASANDLGPAKGPRLALIVHMAEGGGTVAYLARPNPNGVSVHFVVERAGRTVQMLPLDHMHSSIRPTDIRTTDDADGFYGVTAARAVMDKWADTRLTLGPNHASIAVEVEGFAATGPNDVQRLAMRSLFAYLAGVFPGIRSLGHADFTVRKACPGRLIEWDRLGGHGGTMGLHVTIPATPATGRLAIPIGTDAIRVADGVHYATPRSVVRNAYAAALTGPNSGAGWLVDLNGDELHFIRAVVGPVFTPATVPVAEPDCTAAIAEAVAADRARARITWEA